MQSAEFVPITAALLPTEPGGLDLYQRESESSGYVLVRSGGQPLLADDLVHLRERANGGLYISKDDLSIYQKHIVRLATCSDPKVTPLPARVAAIGEVVRDVLYSAFWKPDLEQIVKLAEQLGRLISEIITQDQFVANDLFKVLHHDYATFTHSANVGFYCGILAAAMGYPKTQVEHITTGGLLHDLGKLDIDEGILLKQEALQENELSRIHLHPTIGFRKLANRSELCEGQLMMVYQHHERLDGRGYPVGCVADEIHPWAKICSVADVYEALTSHRPYRSPMAKQRALGLLHRDVESAFDPKVLACWKTII